jgi:hypothetical protein
MKLRVTAEIGRHYLGVSFKILNGVKVLAVLPHIVDDGSDSILSIATTA